MKTPLIALFVIVNLIWSGSCNGQTYQLATQALQGSAWHDALRTVVDGSLGPDTKIYGGGILGVGEDILRRIEREEVDGCLCLPSELISIDARFESLSGEILMEIDRLDPRLLDSLRSKASRLGYDLWLVGRLSNWKIWQIESSPRNPSIFKHWTPTAQPVLSGALQRLGQRVVTVPLSDLQAAMHTGLVNSVLVSSDMLVEQQWQLAGWQKSESIRLSVPVFLVMRKGESVDLKNVPWEPARLGGDVAVQANYLQKALSWIRNVEPPADKAVIQLQEILRTD